MLAARRMMNPRGCGSVLTTTPFSDNFNRADGDPGLPWYNPRNDVPKLGIVSNTLQSADNNFPRNRAALLFPSTDLDVTFTVHFSAHTTSTRNDMQFWFRANTCIPPDDGIACDAFGVTMQPNAVDEVGGHGISIYRQDPGGFTEIVTRDDGLVTEGSTHTIRVHVYGTVCDVYLDDLTTVYVSATAADLSGQKACYFVAGKTGSYFDDVSFATPAAPLVYDSFDRADNSSSLGSADSGQSWTVSGGAFGTGVFGINSDKAFAAYTAATFNAALIDSGSADTEVSASLTLSGSGRVNIGLIMRATNANNVLYCAIGATSPSNGFVSINKIVSGSYTQLASSTPSIAPGSTVGVSAVTSGSSVTIYVNGTSVLTYTLTSGEMATFLGSATKQGMQSFTDTGADDGWSRWDNYRVE